MFFSQLQSNDTVNQQRDIKLHNSQFTLEFCVIYLLLCCIIIDIMLFVKKIYIY